MPHHQTLNPGLAAAHYVRAFSTLGCPDLDLDGVLGLARAHGVPAVELRVLGGALDLPAYFSGRGDSAAALSSAIAASGVRVVALCTSLSLMDASDGDVEKFLEFAPWADAMGVPWLRVFDGGRDARPVELDRAAAVVARWRVLRAARGWGTDIMVETHDALSTGEAIGRFTAAVPGVRILWDTHHTWVGGGESPAYTWRSIHASVAHIHVKDSRLAGDAGRGRIYTLPGTGDFPMADLRGALGPGYTGAVSLEWERQWHPELPPLGEALLSASSRSWW
jgi:sugar phosphate isomerase/epimerase